jgi:lysyl-tRNA synthetase class 1
MLMVQQASFFSGADRVKKVFERLLKYKAVAELTPDLQHKIQLACNWSDDYISTDKFDVVLTDKEKAIVKYIVNNLETATTAEKNLDAEKIQQLIYETSKHHEEQPKKIFKLFYRMLINADSGPKLGGYISDLGLDKTQSLLRSYI